MKKLAITTLLMAVTSTLFSQSPLTSQMEKRAREFFRVISQAQESEWKKFIIENYTKALIERPVKVDIQDQDTQSSTAAVTGEPLESKVAMYRRLHNDFGNSKIISLTLADGEVFLVLRNEHGLQGNFKFAYEKKEPSLIDGLSSIISLFR